MPFTADELRKREDVRDAVDHVTGVMMRNPTNTGWAAAGRMAKQMSESLVIQMATAWLLDQARHDLRARSLNAERQAESSEAVPSRRGARAKPDSDGLVHGSTNQRNGGVTFGCTCKLCATTREIEADHQRRLHESLNDAIATYTKALRIRWTDELLASTFSLPDGTRVLWGEATVEQHQARVEMLTKQVEAVAETAGRHLAAIDVIRQNEAATLNEALHITEGEPA